MPGRVLARIALLVAGLAVQARADGPVSVAAAANLALVMDALNAQYALAAPGSVVHTSTGSSGSLVAQIRNGAPFDVFLSADVDYPQALLKSADAVPGTLRAFATGRLVLWTVRPGIEIGSVEAAVRSPRLHTLAVANTDTAPYGRAARQALGRLGLWEAAEPRLVVADNISQAAQFVETGNADAGFVALSAVLSPKLRGRGRWTEVPQALYDPLVQAAVVTRHGAANPEARRYLDFLGSDPARKVFSDFGYGVPVDNSHQDIPTPAAKGT